MGTYACDREEKIRRIQSLVKEGMDGITVRDTLPNTAYEFSGEAEMAYFKNAREFAKTSLAHIIMECK